MAAGIKPPTLNHQTTTTALFHNIRYRRYYNPALRVHLCSIRTLSGPGGKLANLCWLKNDSDIHCRIRQNLFANSILPVSIILITLFVINCSLKWLNLRKCIRQRSRLSVVVEEGEFCSVLLIEELLHGTNFHLFCQPWQSVFLGGR